MHPMSVLLVCTGNVCRSPAGQLWLQHALGTAEDSGVRVASAGVRAMAGAPVCPAMSERLEATGVSPAGFGARQLEPSMVREAELVLTASRAHRALITDALPPARDRIFTLREFARLAVAAASGAGVADVDATPAGRLRALVPLAADRRSGDRHRGSGDDIVDPMNQPSPVVDEAADHIWAAVAAIAHVVEGEVGWATRTPVDNPGRITGRRRGRRSLGR